MAEKDTLHNRLRSVREEDGMSQQELAGYAGVSRQTIAAIESGRQFPSTLIALRLAKSLGTTVEALFQAPERDPVRALLAPPAPGSVMSGRAQLARIRGQWVAHLLPMNAAESADGLTSQWSGAPRPNTFEFLSPLKRKKTLESRIFVAGCAPLIATLARRVEDLCPEVRVGWVHAGTQRALELLEQGLVHVAGVHLGDASRDMFRTETKQIIRERFSGTSMRIANLCRWQQGLVVRPGNPRGIYTVPDLVRDRLTVARREEGAGAAKLVTRVLAEERIEQPLPDGPMGYSHFEVARLVASGAADVGVAIEHVAACGNLDFVPLQSEAFDLVTYADMTELTGVTRLLSVLDSDAFRREAGRLPGYDTRDTGQTFGTLP